MIISDHIKQIVQLLKNSEQPRLEAELLLCYVLQKPRSYVFAHPEQLLTLDQIDQLYLLTKRRFTGEPMAYLLGEKEFWSLPLKVTIDTLIPRPETELLVALALQTLPENVSQRLADLGTGSGAIALAIASERPMWQIFATDNSDKALCIAKKNAEQLGIKTVNFSQGVWCEALPKTCYDAILSNPPYIAKNDKHLNEGDVRFEPRQALVADEQGLQALTTIIYQAKEYLAKGGWLMLEHGYDQASLVKEMMLAMGYHSISTHIDLAGHERVTMGCLTDFKQNLRTIPLGTEHVGFSRPACRKICLI